MGHLDSEANFFERIRQEGRERPDPQRIIFPEEPTIGRGAKVARAFPKRQMVAEPNYVCHGRLFFEEPNSERHGWDLGILQPVVSVGEFYLDVALLPYHFWTDPCRRYDSSAGKCLPGDPVPYMIYPPELSLTGGVMEAGIGVALFAIFP